MTGSARLDVHRKVGDSLAGRYFPYRLHPIDLKERVGGTVSYANLARDLEYDQTTIKRWLELLENLYIIFRVTPYSNNIARSLLKEPKFYFYDNTYAENGDSAKLENIVANALFKELHYLEDTQGVNTSLHYLRTKDGKELDFLVCIDTHPTAIIEVKQSDLTPAKGFDHFSKYFSSVKMLQVVKECKRDKTYPSGLSVISLIPWLAKLDLVQPPC